MTLRLAVATHNAHKLTEFRRMIAAALPAAEVVSAGGPAPTETGVSFAENAEIKARAGAAACGGPALADDSGLCVEVLGGAPGIFSARWGGESAGDETNRRLLLAQLRDIPESHRGARFVCALCLYIPASESGPERVRTVLGEWPGRILHEERGSEGFGYDPIFAPAGTPRSAAELAPEAKDADSHRHRALERMLPILREELGGAAL
ncbi:MAG: RdgB/HAM1 family non-canonical purine NTP pyrophosphatase [Microbacteriaceae bacterium]|jgi:XTP/dITP diphosphohydrolase|nr:RdgB/HAM1 family non-canonical purine NTP pyrophosphatase [Microbacteriaceae bacterium]MCI1207501.1 RdgB/HAM1 family non-canonical purine NTP pyrophosphatase [Microbacteriaceae bacterium]